jgi:hypothetical protein
MGAPVTNAAIREPQAAVRRSGTLRVHADARGVGQADTVMAWDPLNRLLIVTNDLRC